MYDSLLEHSLSAGIVGIDLSGEGSLLEQTKPIDKKCKRVVKLFFDIEQHDKPTIYFETEVIFDEAHRKYLYFGVAGRSGTMRFMTTDRIDYLTTSSKKKNPIIANREVFVSSRKIENIFYEASSNKVAIKPTTVFIDINNKSVGQDLNNFKKYASSSLLVIGIAKQEKYLLFSESRKYRKMIDEISSLREVPKKEIKKRKNNIASLAGDNITDICDFCKQIKPVKTNFTGKGTMEVNNLKTFTSTKRSLCYQLDNKDIRKDLRCCESCFNLIAKIDRRLETFKIGSLQEKTLNAKKTNRFIVYATIQNPMNVDLNFKKIHNRLESIFGGDKNAFDSIKNESGTNPIFDKKIIFNIYIADFNGQSHSTILNIRNINPRLFEKYFKIMEFISGFNEYFTYRGWKGSFSDIFKTLSMADYRVGLEVFAAILNNFPIDSKRVSEIYGRLLRKRFLNSEDKKEPEIKYLPIDIFSILLFEQLRMKEEILEFNKELFLTKEEIKDENKKVVEIRYKPKSTVEIKQLLGTDWSEAEIAVIDLGRFVSSIIFEIKKAKNTDIEKVFFSKVNFVEMGFDDVRAYCGFLEQKMGEYSKAIQYLDFKRNELGLIQLILEKNKNQAVSPKAVGYFLSFGYNINGLLWSKAAQEGERETINLKNQGA